MTILRNALREVAVHLLANALRAAVWAGPSLAAALAPERSAFVLGGRVGDLGVGVLSVVTAYAAGNVGQLPRAPHAAPPDIRVLGVMEPRVAPEAALLELGRELVALIGGAGVGGEPDAPLRRAAV